MGRVRGSGGVDLVKAPEEGPEGHRRHVWGWEVKPGKRCVVYLTRTLRLDPWSGLVRVEFGSYRGITTSIILIWDVSPDVPRRL